MLNFVSHFPQENPWSLIFHANGYGLSHMMPLSVAFEMGTLVQEKYKNLEKVYIVEGHWFFQFLLRVILPFLQQEMGEKFVLVNGSLLEVVAFFRQKGLTVQQMEPLRTRFG